MEETIEQEIAELSRMTVGQLKQKYIEVFGEETGASTFTIPVAGNGAYTSGGTVAIANSAEAHSVALGDAIVERDMPAVNSGVIPAPAPTTGSVNYAY